MFDTYLINKYVATPRHATPHKSMDKRHIIIFGLGSNEAYSKPLARKSQADGRPKHVYRE